MNDLTWLARNVHEWPNNEDGIPSEFIYTSAFLVNGYGIGQPGDIFDERCATRDQWIAERARLQNKPKWEDAPEWADALVQTESGIWFWCVGDQVPNELGGWKSINQKEEDCDSGKVLGDWRDTLERRPDKVKEIKFPEDVEWMGDTKEWKQGELPPVGEKALFVFNESDVEFSSEIDQGLKSGDEVEVLAHYSPCKNGDLVAVFAYEIEGGMLTSQAVASCFRPLRTEEEKAVEEMVNIGVKAIESEGYGDTSMLKYMAKALYRADYRKP